MKHYENFCHPAAKIDAGRPHTSISGKEMLCGR
jgi:hypothetical protein